MDPQERFFAKVKVNEKTNCWEWTASRTCTGYSRFHLEKKWRAAHRVSYEWFIGEIPADKEIDHLCRVRHCVNPEHLEAVSHRANTLRGETIPAKHVAKTHCPQGHIYDKANTYIDPKGRRNCRICSREKTNHWHINNKEKRQESRRNYWQDNKDWINAKRRIKYNRKVEQTNGN